MVVVVACSHSLAAALARHEAPIVRRSTSFGLLRSVDCVAGYWTLSTSSGVTVTLRLRPAGAAGGRARLGFYEDLSGILAFRGRRLRVDAVGAVA